MIFLRGAVSNLFFWIPPSIYSHDQDFNLWLANTHHLVLGLLKIGKLEKGSKFPLTLRFTKKLEKLELSAYELIQKNQRLKTASMIPLAPRFCNAQTSTLSPSRDISTYIYISTTKKHRVVQYWTPLDSGDNAP